MKKSFKALAGAAAVAAVFASSSAFANLVVNGSFEDNVLANGTWNIFYNGSVNGWSSAPPLPDEGIEIRNNVAGAAFDGVNFVELDTHRNSIAYQGISTILGQAYEVSFAYSGRPGVGAASNPIEAYWNGVSIGNFTTNSASATVNNWLQFSVFVTGTGTDTLKFAAVGTSDSYGGSLDAVSVTAIPEPGIYAMMAAGLGLMGFVARRRKLHDSALV